MWVSLFLLKLDCDILLLFLLLILLLILLLFHLLILLLLLILSSLFLRLNARKTPSINSINTFRIAWLNIFRYSCNRKCILAFIFLCYIADGILIFIKEFRTWVHKFKIFTMRRMVKDIMPFFITVSTSINVQRSSRGYSQFQ